MHIHSQQHRNNKLVHNLILYIFVCIVKQIYTLSPSFLTTLTDCKTGSAVLTVSSPTTANGYDTTSTSITFPNEFTQAPNVALGLNYLSSIYTTTTNLHIWVIDLSVQTTTSSLVVVQFNRTTSIVSQIAINYLAVLSTSFLQVTINKLDLSTTTVYTVTSAQSRSVPNNITYRTKSNSTNAIIMLNTIGLYNIRQSVNTYSYTISITGKYTNAFQVTVSVAAYNRLLFITIVAISYQSIATIVLPPLYLSMGYISDFSGTIPENSGAVGVTTMGTIFAGMTQWTIDDSNGVNNLNFTVSGNSYTITSTSLTSCQNSYTWYRQQTCPQYYYLFNHVCYTCDITCSTCSGSSSTRCTSCPTTRSFNPLAGTCTCLTGYVDQGARDCILVSCNTDLCKTCANINQCGSCYNFLFRVLNGTQCSCMGYRYDSYSLTGSPFCDACHYSCLTCTSAASTACLTCNTTRDNRAFQASTSTCLCISGYFDSGTTICSSCNYTCATCTSSLVCTSCNSTLGRIFNNTNCICSPGLYDNRLQQQCQTCMYSCSTCTDAISCATCPSTRYLANTTSNNQCICLNGYYDNGISKQCLSCQYTCSQCLISTLCTGCSSTMRRQFNNNTKLCSCSTGYYDDGTNQLCATCHISCLGCTGSTSTNCTSCNAATYRTLALTGQCLCSNGYYPYDNFTKICATCFYTCATCVNEFSCTSCNNLKYRIVDSTNLSKCICMDRYYDTGNQLCSTCLYYCLTCTNFTSCLTCDTVTRNISNSCACLTGYYDDGVSNQCRSCLTSCVTCANAFNCTSCTPIIKYLASTGQCKCSAGYLQPSCTPCSYQCQQCSISADNCVACDGLSYRYYVYDNTTDKGLCNCYQGYYSDNINVLCKSCHYSCLSCTTSTSCINCPTNRQFDTNNQYCICVSQYYQNNQSLNCLPCHYSCANCTDYSICTLCNAGKNRIMNAITKLCGCNLGYYDDGNSELCYTCAGSCLTCTAFLVCTSCDTVNKYRVFNNITRTCPCTQGYYQSTTDYLCYACNYSCLSCIDSTSCVSCIAGRTFDINTGLCRCADGTFQNSTTKTCQLCTYPCTKCINTASTCVTCQATHLLLVSASSCYCPTGTYENTTRCVSCLTTCNQCINNFSCTSCRPRDNRQLVLVSSVNICNCIAGFHDQTNTIVTCITCHYSCTTCTNSQSCTTCTDIRIMLNGTNSNCSCPLQRFYDDGTNGPCLPCSFLCLSCNKLSTNCSSCSSSGYRYQMLTDASINTYTCLCNAFYYSAGAGIQTCLPCHYSCSSCLNSTHCQTCNSTLFRILQPSTTTYCACGPGYYDVTNIQTCQTCSYTCRTCSQTNMFCLSCPSTRNFTGNTCQCNTGLFDDLVSNNPTCSSCLYMCSTCSTGTTCLTCPATRAINSSFLCPCISGYYDTGINNQCLPCAPKCQQCSDYQTCTSCFPVQLRVNFNSACICQSGYYDQTLILPNSTNYTCQICHHSCQRCQNSLSCSSCDSTMWRTRDINTGFCECIDGYYDDGINQLCLVCSFDCLTCSDRNSCLTCPPQRTLDTVNTHNRCLCSSTYYTNGTICQSCPNQCASCTSYTVCTACNNPSQRTLVSGACICNSQLYSISNTAQCTSCFYSCTTCVSYPFCSTCSSSAHRYLSAKQCKCLTSFYDDLSSQICQPCPYSCLTCTNSSECLTCDSSLNRSFNTSSLFCSCSLGFYQDPSLKICVSCNYSCFECSGPNNCTSCSPITMRTLTTGICNCPFIGYFNKPLTPICANCDPTCYTCTNLATTCTDCNTNITFRVLTSFSTCVCQSGYFQQSSLTVICSTCFYKCMTCSSPSTQCTSCSVSNNRDNATIPVCSCLKGYYDDGSSPQCKLCDYRCQTCLDLFTCVNCDFNVSHRQLNLVNSMCQCANLYYQPVNGNITRNPVCLTCHYSCLSCNHASICLTCDLTNNTRYFNNGQCLCTSGYYDNGINILCMPCNYICETCTIANRCQTCNAINNRVFNSNNGLCQCLRGYYDPGNSIDSMCYPCHSSCYTCTNSTVCTNCYPLVNKYINTTQGTNYCICLYGYYEVVSTGICSKCHYSCQKCIGQATSCTSCDITAFRSLIGGSCPCNIGYFDDGRNQQCLLCTTNCVSCFGTNPGQCLKCMNGTYLLNGVCYTRCPAFYYPINSTWVCGSCTSYCTNCSDNIVCNLCQSGFYLIPASLTTPTSNIICTNRCPQFYYHNITACLQCKSPCLHCTGLYICTDCIQNYFLDNVTKQCYPCHPTCRFCTSSSVLGCISCVDGYFYNSTLKLCVKITCASNQYVNSVYGCYNCQNTYPNSLQCNANYIISCINGYQLITNITTGVKKCTSCAKIAGYTLTSTGFCQQICGDSINYNDPCDDGNILNGDGCSSICTVQQGWDCNTTICTLSNRITPTMIAQSFIKVPKQNQILVIVALNIGIRLVKQNFRISFSGLQKYQYNVTALNLKYTRYQVMIEYYQQVARSKLSISVISPISTSNTHTRSLIGFYDGYRMLQSTSIGLSISLSLNVEVQVLTEPPAVYYSVQSRNNYQIILFIIMIVLHVASLLIFCYFSLYLRLKNMLFVIQMFNFITILYMYSTYGMFKIFQLSPESGRALQHFIYKFGQDLPNQYANINTNAGYFGFGAFLLAGCIIQLTIITVCIFIKTIYGGISSNASLSELQDKKRKYNAFRYYHLSFLFAFVPDLLLCCVIAFKWVDINNSIQSAYSWGIAIIVFIMIIIGNMMYITYAYPYARIIDKNNKKNSIVHPLPFSKTKEIEQKQRSEHTKQKNWLTEQGKNNNITVNFVTVEEAIQKKQKQELAYQNITNDPFDPFAQETKNQNNNSKYQSISEKSSAKLPIKNKNNLNSFKRKLTYQQQQQNKTQAVIFDNQQKSQYSQFSDNKRKYIKNNDKISETSQKTNSTTLTQIKKQQLIPLFDLTPSDVIYSNLSNVNISYYRMILHQSYLPFKCTFISLFVCIAVQVQEPIPRCSLLVLAQLMVLVYLCISMRLRNIRTINLIIMSIILLGIAVCGLMGALIIYLSKLDQNWAKSLNYLYILQAISISLIVFGVICNGIFFTLQTIKSNQYRQYRIEVKNKQIIQKNIRKNRLRGISVPNQQINQSFGSKNIFANIRHQSGYEYGLDRIDTKQHLRIDSEINTPAQYNDNTTSNILIGINSKADKKQLFDIQDIQDAEQMNNNIQLKINKKLKTAIQQQKGNTYNTLTTNKKLQKFPKEKQLIFNSIQEIQLPDEGQTNNLQSTRLNQSKAIKKVQQRQNLLSKEIQLQRSNNFMDMLQNQLRGEDNNETILILGQKKKKTIEIDKDNTLISYKGSENYQQKQQLKNKKQKERSNSKNILKQIEQKIIVNSKDSIQQMQKNADFKKKGTFSIIKNLVPTRQNENQNIIGNNKKTKNVMAYFSGQKQEIIPNNNIPIKQKFIQQFKSDQQDLQENQQQIFQQQRPTRQKQIYQNIKNRDANKRKIKVQNKQQQKKIKIKKVNQNIHGLKRNKNQKIQQDQSQQNQIEIQPNVHRKVNKDKDIQKIQGLNLPKGLKDDGFENQNYKIKRNNPNKKLVNLKRIDSISSISQQNNELVRQRNGKGYQFQFKQDDSLQSQGMTVFKKILQDYQIYKHKKVKGNNLRKKQ